MNIPIGNLVAFDELLLQEAIEEELLLTLLLLLFEKLLIILGGIFDEDGEYFWKGHAEEWVYYKIKKILFNLDNN